MKQPVPYKKGDIVKHKAKFLQSVQWHTNVPINGRVDKDQDVEEDGDLVSVTWSDGHKVYINSANIMLASRPDHG